MSWQLSLAGISVLGLLIVRIICFSCHRDNEIYHLSRPQPAAIAALVIPREKILRPILAGVGKPNLGRKPKNWSSIDEHYEAVRQDMFTLMEDLRIAA